MVDTFDSATTRIRVSQTGGKEDAKKGILILLVLMLMVVVMIGCKAESQPQDEAPQATESNQAEQSAPIESDEPAAKVGEVQPISALVEVTQQELILYFETAYDAGQIYADLGYDEDSLVEQELKELTWSIGKSG